MNLPRYTVYSVSGWLEPGIGNTAIKPPIVWYVADDLRCGEIVGEFDNEHEALRLRIKLAALDREFEKRWERNGA